MKNKYFFHHFPVLKLCSNRSELPPHVRRMYCFKLVFYNVLLNLIKLRWLFPGADSSLKSGSETTQTNAAPHKSNVREVQLATNWAHSSHFDAQFPSQMKTSKMKMFGVNVIRRKQKKKKKENQAWPLQ